MARRSSRRSGSGNAADNDGDDDAAVEADSNRLPTDMRERNRVVAEREASRLARPERRTVSKLGHASRAKSAVTSTPFGYHAKAGVDKSSEKESDNEWCGPFSVARQMIAKREEARRKRETEQSKNEMHHPLDDMMAEVELEQKRKAHPSLQWRGQLPEGDASSDNLNLYAKRQKRVRAQNQDIGKTLSLFQLCVNFLVQNFEHVEALGDVDSSIRSSICKELVAKNKLDAPAFDAIAETGIEALELVDCAEVTQDQLANALQSLVPAGLRFLLLNHAGRCFGPKAVKAIISSSTNTASLFAISIGGAYLLTDEDAASLVSAAASSLSSIEFKACPLLGSQFCSSLGKNFASVTNNRLLELQLEDLQLSKETLLSLAVSSDALCNLKSLSLRQCKAVDDEVIQQLLGAVGNELESVDLSYNYDLTDEVLSSIRKCNKDGALRSLHLCALKNLSAAGLEAFFTQIPGLPNPPMLRTLNMAGCDYEAVTDDVMELVLKASSMKPQEEGPQSSSLSNMGGMIHLNIDGTSCTDHTMEGLATTSASSLKVLDVSFCPKISDQGLGYLVSKAGNQLNKIRVWGCAQVTDEFLDGHARVGDNKFEIEGAWMKKAGARSLR